jgi:hypothetical protein
MLGQLPKGLGHFMNQSGAFVNEACVNLNHIGSSFYFAHSIVSTQNSAHANDGKLGSEVLPQQTNDPIATRQHWCT